MGKHIKIALILTSLMIVIGVILGMAYMSTEKAIAKADLNAKLSAIKFVLTNPKTGKLLVSEDQIPTTLSELTQKTWKSSSSKILYSDPKYPGFVLSPVYQFLGKNGEKIYVITGFGLGFGGRVSTIAGFVQKKNGFYENAIDVIDYSNETPGMGAKINDPDIRKRFFSIPNSGLEKGLKVNKDAFLFPLPKDYLSKLGQYKKKGIVVTSDVMTGATITPRAVVNSLNAMYDFLEKEAK